MVAVVGMTRAPRPCQHGAYSEHFDVYGAQLTPWQHSSRFSAVARMIRPNRVLANMEPIAGQSPSRPQ
jgi:hypothetical protein